MNTKTKEQYDDIPSVRITFDCDFLVEDYHVDVMINKLNDITRDTRKGILEGSFYVDDRNKVKWSFEPSEV